MVRYFTDLRVMVQGGEGLLDDAGTFLPDGSPENHGWGIGARLDHHGHY